MVPSPFHHSHCPPSTDDFLQQVPLYCGIYQYSLQEYETTFRLLNPMLRTIVHSVSTLFPICVVLYLCIQHSNYPLHGFRILYSRIPQATKGMVCNDTCTGKPQRYEIRRSSVSSYDRIDGETNTVDGKWRPISFQSRVLLPT